MRSFLLRYAGLPVLFLTLIFFSGLTSIAVAAKGVAAAEICCEKEAPAPAQEPASDGQCVDPGCRCLSCSVSVLQSLPHVDTVQPDLPRTFWGALLNSSSDYIQSIDYPPEFA